MTRTMQALAYDAVVRCDEKATGQTFRRCSKKAVVLYRVGRDNEVPRCFYLCREHRDRVTYSSGVQS